MDLWVFLSGVPLSTPLVSCLELDQARADAETRAARQAEHLRAAWIEPDVAAPADEDPRCQS